MTLQDIDIDIDIDISIFREPFKSWTSKPDIVDVCAANLLLSCGPGGGEELFDPHPSGRKGLDVRGKIGPKSLSLCCFSSLTIA